MHLRTGLSLGIAAGILAAITSIPASAQVLVPIAIAGNISSVNNVTYTAGAPGTGGLSVFTATGFLAGKVGQGFALPVTITFPTLVNAGTYTFNAATGGFDQPLAGSSFTIMQGATNLLSGTFGSSDLTGQNNSGSAGVNLVLNSVTYNPASTFLPAGFLNTQGSLSIEFIAPTPIAANAAGVPNFVANDGITFSARSPVPEPGSVALLSSLGVCGTAFGISRLRRRRK